MNISGNTTDTGVPNDISVYERQQARMTWQNQHHNSNLFNDNDHHFSGLIHNIKPDPGFENGLPDFSDDQKIKKRKTHEDMNLKV